MALNKLLILFALILVSSIIVSAVPARTLGDPDAPVTIELFASFEDPNSAQWYLDTFPKINTHYISEGHVQLFVRHFPMSELSTRPHAEDASIAAECASQQNAFFEYIDVVYNNQDKLTGPNLGGYAADIGLEPISYRECFINSITKKLVRNEALVGERQHVKETPTFFINGDMIVGAQDYQFYAEFIDRHLGKPHNETGYCGDELCQESEYDRCKKAPPEKQCQQIGYRKKANYCDLEYQWQIQKVSTVYCDNQFECMSNSCIDNACTQPGFWARLIKGIYLIFA
jgi:protein-disulfide isomerase